MEFPIWNSPKNTERWGIQMSQSQVYENRLNRFYQWMDKNDLSVALISSPTNVYYLTGFYSNPHERFMGLFLISGQEPILITPELDKEEANRKTSLNNIFGYADHEGPVQLIKKYILFKQDQPFGFEEGYVSFKKALWLKEILQFQQSVDIEKGLMGLRITKDELELNSLKEAAYWADKAIEFGIEAIQVGKSELEIIAEIEYRLKKEGIEKMSFDTMVLTGEKSALPHGKPGQERIKNGDFVLFDLGVVFNGYCSDISRTVAVGQISEKQKEMYHIVKQAQQLAIDVVKPDLAIKEVDLAARRKITEMGFGPYFIHRIGHGLGLDIHELPSMHEKNEELLKEGMVFTIEPGIYVAELGGVRIEDDIYVTKEGPLVLTSFTKELIQL